MSYYQAIVERAENALMAFFSANIFLTIFSAGLMQLLWGLINTLQIIVLTYLFNLDIPMNASMLMVMLLKLCSMEFFSTDELFDKMFDFRETEPYNTIVHANGDKESKYDDAGYETTIFFLLLGPIFFLVLIFLAYVLFKRFI